MTKYVLVELPDNNETIQALSRHHGWRTADVTDLMLTADQVEVPLEYDYRGSTLPYLAGYGKVVDTMFERMRTSGR